MKKRGISPMIAVVVIIGLVFIVGVFLNIFVKEFSKEQTEDIEFKANLDRICVEKTDLDLVDICKIPATEDIKLTMENRGSNDIEDITFFLTAGDESTTGRVERSLKKFEKKTFTLTAPDYVGSDKLEINYIKHIFFEGEEGDCNSEKIEISVPGENLLLNPSFDQGVDGSENWLQIGSQKFPDFNGNNISCYSIGDIADPPCATEQIVNINPNKEYNVGTFIYVENPIEDLSNYLSRLSIVVRFDDNANGVYEVNEKVVRHPTPEIDPTLVGVVQSAFTSVDPTSHYIDDELGFVIDPNGYSRPYHKEKVGLPVHSIDVWIGSWSKGADDLKVWFDDAEVRESKISICE
jgi:hypothetical protein